MKLKSRGWDRNHGWRTLAQKSVKDARRVDGEWRMRGDEVLIEFSEIPAHQQGGGRANIYFKAEINNPALNGNYMMNLALSRYDIARLFKEMIVGCPAEELLKLLHEVGPDDDDDDD